MKQSLPVSDDNDLHELRAIFGSTRLFLGAGHDADRLEAGDDRWLKRVMMAGAVSFQFAEDVRKKEKNPSARIAAALRLPGDSSVAHRR
jgi:hypothetical protein